MELLIYGAMHPEQLRGEATGHHIHDRLSTAGPTTPGDEGHVGDQVPGNAIFHTNG